MRPVVGAWLAQPQLLLMYHHTTFFSGHLPRQEHGDAAADGEFHPLAGTLVAKEAGRLAHQGVQRQADMLAEDVLGGISDLFRGDIRGLPARLGAVTREAEGMIVGGLQVVRPQEQIITILHDTHLRSPRQLLHALLDVRGEAGKSPVGRQTTGRKAKAHGPFGGDDGAQCLA